MNDDETSARIRDLEHAQHVLRQYYDMRHNPKTLNLLKSVNAKLYDARMKTTQQFGDAGLTAVQPLAVKARLIAGSVAALLLFALSSFGGQPKLVYRAPAEGDYQITVLLATGERMRSWVTLQKGQTHEAFGVLSMEVKPCVGTKPPKMLREEPNLAKRKPRQLKQPK